MPPQRVTALYKVIDLFFKDHVVSVLKLPTNVAKNKRGPDLNINEQWLAFEQVSEIRAVFSPYNIRKVSVN